ncbi:MAG: GTPase-associated system all-helical protein GASH [Terriglobales bacterium]
MHKHFADWHRAAGLEPKPDTAPKHWDVIEGYRPQAEEIVSLARVFYGVDTQGDTNLDKFGMALQDVDPNFSMQRDKQYLALFAGAELMAIIEREAEHPLPDLAALCLVCGAAQGLRTAIPVPEMPNAAARYIESRTGKRASMTETATDEADSKPARLERELTIVGEEVDMLWWLISEYSRDRNEPWKIVALATPIVAGKELADLTRVIPGPVAAAAFLDRIVLLSGSAQASGLINVKETIEKTPREWREQYRLKAATGIEELAPVSKAIRLSLTVSEGDNWSPVFEKGTGLQASSQISPRALAYQVFLERLLARLSREVGQL